MICPVCRRAPRGFGWFDARYKFKDARRDTSRRWFCSLRCLDGWAASMKEGKMIDPTDNEIAAMQEGASRGGEYLDSIGKASAPLDGLSEDEFMTFVECICTGFVEHLQKVGAIEALANKPPF